MEKVVKIRRETYIINGEDIKNATLKSIPGLGAS